MKVAPITFREASEYINRLHRHHRATVGCKFCISVVDDDGQDWLVERETATQLVLRHRHFDSKTKIIPKGVREDG